MRALPVAFFFACAACNFGDDRSLGSLQAAPLSGSGGTTTTTTAPTAGLGAGAANTGGTVSETSAPTAPTCSTTDTSRCVAKEYCAFSMDCGMFAATGLCVEKPSICPVPSGQEVVCGCDHNYYDSACTAALAGVSLAPLENCSPVECEAAAADACSQFEESCPNYYGADMPHARCDGDLHRCVCQRDTVIL